MNSKYPHLFTPLKVNHMILKNRVISGPLGDQEDKSLSGIGMIIKGGRGNIPGGRSRPDKSPGMFENLRMLEKAREEVSVMRQGGAKASLLLVHVGQYAVPRQGDFALGAISYLREDGIPVRSMNEEDMQRICDAYGQAAMAARDIGFDSVMLHFGHGWLPHQFLSPTFNKRTDEYGGSLENRMRFPLMLVKAVRDAVGRDYPIDMRISAFEFSNKRGMQFEDVVAFLKEAQDYLDMVNLSAGIFHDLDGFSHSTSSSLQPHCYLTEHSRQLKQALRIPVGVVGSIMTPEEAEEIIASGKADAIILGRQIIADPLWTTKAYEGRAEDIVPCLRCSQCFPGQGPVQDRINEKSLSLCPVNPRHGRSGRIPPVLHEAAEKKKVLVIGGGPAGIRAAVVASQRGHSVTLLEKSDSLGGQLKCADFDSHKADLKRYKDYMIRQLMRSSAAVHLNVDADANTIVREQPDAVIIAIGANPITPAIPGVELPNVLQATDAYRQLGQLQGRIVVIGGGVTGCELSLTLAERGISVSLVELRDSLCIGSDAIFEYDANRLIHESPLIDVYTGASCRNISRDHVLVACSGKELSIPCDTVILSTGFRPDYDKIASYYGIIQNTNVIGDAQMVGTMLKALEEGFFLGNSI